MSSTSTPEPDEPLAFASTVPVVAKPDVLSKDERAVARLQWRKSRCTWCGGLHLRACPRVKRLMFANDGKTVTEVEYWPGNLWSDKDVVWPEDLNWEEDANSPFEPVPEEG